MILFLKEKPVKSLSGGELKIGAGLFKESVQTL